MNALATTCTPSRRTGSSRRSTGARRRGAAQLACALGMCAALVATAPAAGANDPAPSAAPALAADGPSVQGTDLDGLLLALDRQYRLAAIYDRAVADFGARGALAEARLTHRARVDRLVRLYPRYGLAVPANPWTRRTPSFESREHACVAAFRAELDLAVSFDHLSAAADRPELAAAYAAARDTSRGPSVEGLRSCALAAR